MSGDDITLALCVVIVLLNVGLDIVLCTLVILALNKIYLERAVLYAVDLRYATLCKDVYMAIGKGLVHTIIVDYCYGSALRVKNIATIGKVWLIVAQDTQQCRHKVYLRHRGRAAALQSAIWGVEQAYDVEISWRVVCPLSIVFARHVVGYKCKNCAIKPLFVSILFKELSDSPVKISSAGLNKGLTLR